MTNVMITGSNYNVLQGTMPDNGTLTHEIDLAEYTLTGLICQTPGWLAGTLTFQVSDIPDAEGGVFTDLYRDNAVVAEAVPAGRFAVASDVLVRALAGYRYVKVKSSVSQTGGPITFKMPVKA